MLVLGIESSCDDTAAAVVGDAVVSEVTWSQEIHARFGGVVPEIASRAHAEKAPAVVRAALADARIERPDVVAATSGPGLLGAVLVGHSLGKGLALGWGVRFVAVNHLEAHLLAPLLETPAPDFPFLGLLISGGHTALYEVGGVGRYRLLGETADDAVGECFDKVARMLGLPYPGGPAVEALAARGDPRAVAFPRPRVGELGFSFSGLKTAVKQHVEGRSRAADADITASFQGAVVDVLVDRVRNATSATGIARVAIGGGAAANSAIRAGLLAAGFEVYAPPRARCTDNAAMIASCARLRLRAGFPASALDTGARARWGVGEE
jgi:N6-L-threonylcarbamoyladenine synthase